MNILGFVFCILAVLSIGAFFAFEKKVEAYRLRSTYVGHIGANRQILNQVASNFYASLKSVPKEKTNQDHEKPSQNPKPPKAPPINPPCARLNLYPLIETNLNQEPSLYEAAAQLLRFFYSTLLFDKKSRAEYQFLDSFLKEVREQIMDQEFSVLEKVSFKDPRLQKLYYQMLKGTKDGRYPSLLDYIKIERPATKLCLHHAHPDLLSAFFTPKGGAKLFTALHTPKAPAVTCETIEGICLEVHALLTPEVIDLFELHQKQHPKAVKATLIGSDDETHISLRKTLATQDAHY